MKRRLKMVGVICVIVFVLFLLIVGILNLNSIDLTFAGNINYSFGEVMATVSSATIENSASNLENKMQGLQLI